jgi:hypothetical protein
MANYTALAEVGKAIQTLLQAQMRADQDLSSWFGDASGISLESPADLEGDNTGARLSIYLYRIVEDPYAKNRDPINDGRRRLQKPPLALDLFYLVTPLFDAVEDQLTLLGKTMQVLYDNSNIVLPSSGDELRIVLNPVTLEETTRVWQALEMSYRLSVCYVVRVALVNSTSQDPFVPVSQKSATYGELEPAS